MTKALKYPRAAADKHEIGGIKFSGHIIVRNLVGIKNSKRVIFMHFYSRSKTAWQLQDNNIH